MVVDKKVFEILGGVEAITEILKALAKSVQATKKKRAAA